jgi:hypothetical protein
MPSLPHPNQYCSVRVRGAINRRQDEAMIIVETAIYRVFRFIASSDLSRLQIYSFHRKTLTEQYCHPNPPRPRMYWGGNWISGFPPFQGGIKGGNLTCVYTVAPFTGRRKMIVE